ncbi:MAG: hypothetical protein IJF78_14240 [Clostridia bacterium]|nr:hypothetical protein [Clostridia bacterium]
MAARENYFIILELSFDPMVTDAAKINEAIEAKRQQWAKNMNHPILKGKAGEYLGQLDEIKRIMLDDALRKAEAEAAKKIRESKKKDLDDKLTLLTARGEELSDRDLNTVLKAFGAFGFTADIIKARFKELIDTKKGGKIDVNAVIDKSQAMNIQKGLNAVDLPDGSLYDFLELPASASCSQLSEKAEAIKKKILAKGEKTPKDNEAQALCGLCIIIFKDKASKQKYDNYYNLTKYPKINSAVDQAAKENKRVIEPTLKEGLVDIACRNYSISPSEASMYISNYCELMGYQEKNRTIVCGLCGTENPAGASTCTKCGKPLIVICPSCGAENGNAVKNCAKCGFDLTKMEQAVELIHKAKTLWNGKKVDEAAAVLKDAKLYWPNHPEIAALEKEISDFKKKFGDVLKNVTAEINEKKYYAAQMLIHQAQNDGFVISGDVTSKVAEVIRNVETKLERVKSMSGDDAFETVLSLTKEISDSVEVNRLISKYPPDAPRNFSSRQIGGTVVFDWEKSASRGEITYILVRKVGTRPNDQTDGEIVYKGTELNFSDSSLQKSTVYCYAVFALRAGVYSQASHLANDVVVVDNVSDIRAIGGDGLITLTWNKPSTVTEVQLEISQGEQTDLTSYRSVPNNRLDGANITDLTNGRKYWISICAYHTVGGKRYPSEKVYVNTVPQKPADLISNFRVDYLDEIFSASWDKAEWDVIILYSLKKPSYVPNVTYDYEELLKTYKQIDISFKSLTKAEFTLNFIGECYIIPGQINASNVILNEAYYISSVPMLKEPSFDLNASRTELYVNFTWPKRIENSLIAYRTDQYPESYSDALACCVECSRKQYESNEGILILNPPSGCMYALIYSYFDSENGRIYGTPIKLLINNEPQRDVYYSFKYKKGLFSKKRTLQITVRSDSHFVLPPFCVISKLRSVPLNRGDGDVVVSAAEDTEIDRSYTFEFEVGDIRKDSKLKLFFMNDKQYRYYRIVNEGSNTIG